MKKSCIPLFVMSIISLLISALSAVSYFDLINSRSQLGAIEQTVENGIALELSKAAVEVDLFFVKVILAAAFILGVSGLVSSIKKGRLSLLCVVLSGLPFAYVFFGVIWFLMRRSDLYELYMPVLIFLALYMTGAVIAFKGRKKLQK